MRKICYEHTLHYYSAQHFTIVKNPTSQKGHFREQEVSSTLFMSEKGLEMLFLIVEQLKKAFLEGMNE